VLRAADVVLYDRLAHPALLEAASHAECRDVGKRFGDSREKQDGSTLRSSRSHGKTRRPAEGRRSTAFARGAEEARAREAGSG
jgi:siroheme synthase